MRPGLVSAVLSGVMIFGTSNIVWAQSRGQINRAIEVNVFGGYTRFSTPGFVDAACWTFAAPGANTQNADCWGDAKGNGIAFGGEVGYRYPLRNGMYLVFQGGAEFGSKHRVEVELEGTEPDLGADVWAMEGYRFRTTHIYGGVGVRKNQMMIGATFGRTLHSGYDYFEAEVGFAGIPIDSTYDEVDRSGSGGLFGLRFQYDLRPGLGVRADYRFFGFDTGTPELPRIKHRTATFGVVVDVPRFFSR